MPDDNYDQHVIYLDYGRYWQDREMTTVNNRLGFDPENILIVEVDKTDCTVNGYEAYYYIDDWGPYPSMRLSLTWLDTDRELVFRLGVPEGFTPEQAIALAESVK